MLTQAELAARAGVPKNSISRIERDALRTRPTARTVRKLAEALGLDPHWLMFGDGKEARDG